MQVPGRQHWWHVHNHRIAGGLRAVSHAMLLLSGLGFSTAMGSKWRALAAVLGLTGAAFISLVGGRHATSFHVRKIRETIGPQHVNRLYFGILTCSAAALAASGFAIGSPTEAIAGLWSVTWTACAAFMPETTSFKPKKLSSDMLQASAAFVLVDAAVRLDALRLISGACLGGSNFAGRRMHDRDYAATTEEESEIEGI